MTWVLLQMIIVLFSIILSGPGENDPKSVEVWLHASWLNLQTHVPPSSHRCNTTIPHHHRRRCCCSWGLLNWFLRNSNTDSLLRTPRLRRTSRINKAEATDRTGRVSEFLPYTCNKLNVTWLSFYMEHRTEICHTTKNDCTWNNLSSS